MWSNKDWMYFVLFFIVVPFVIIGVLTISSQDDKSVKIINDEPETPREKCLRSLSYSSPSGNITCDNTGKVVDLDEQYYEIKDDYDEFLSECTIKGNISFGSGEKIYHVEGQKYYSDTEIDTTFGERYFCSEDEAVNAGWRKSYE